MYRVSHHAVQRYLRRVNPDASPEEAEELLMRALMHGVRLGAAPAGGEVRSYTLENGEEIRFIWKQGGVFDVMVTVLPLPSTYHRSSLTQAQRLYQSLREDEEFLRNQQAELAAKETALAAKNKVLHHQLNHGQVTSVDFLAQFKKIREEEVTLREFAQIITAERTYVTSLTGFAVNSLTLKKQAEHWHEIARKVMGAIERFGGQALRRRITQHVGKIDFTEASGVTAPTTKPGK